MLSPLRKLRKKSSNSKYLKYAIGETFLVVLGILIALGINNINENRKEKKLLYGYLATIQKNIADDTVRINSMSRAYAQKNKTAIRYMNVLLKDSISEELLAEAINLLGEEYLIIDPSGFESLKSSGFLNRIQGKDLEDALFKYYFAFDNAREEETSLNTFVETMEAKLFDQHSDLIIDAIKLIEQQNFPNIAPTKKPTEEVAYELFTNPYLVGIVQRFADEDSPRYLVLKATAYRVLTLIDQEIN